MKILPRYLHHCPMNLAHPLLYIHHFPQLVPSSPQDIPLPKGQYCPWPCVPGCSHPERILKKNKDPDRDPDETESSYEDGTISL